MSIENGLHEIPPTVWAGAAAQTRGRRILPQDGYFVVHVTSRVVQQRLLLDEEAKEAFLNLSLDWGHFSGIQILTVALMDNHFHLYLLVKEREKLTGEQVIERLKRVWPDKKMSQWLKRYDKSSADARRLLLKEQTDRMYDLPAYMRVLKQTFSTWYNRQHNYKGTLWEGRYCSMVVNQVQESLLRVAMYIDLNPVRAGVQETAAACAYTGVTEAVRGNGELAAGIVQLLRMAKCKDCSVEGYLEVLEQCIRTEKDWARKRYDGKPRKGYASMAALWQYAAPCEQAAAPKAE